MNASIATSFSWSQRCALTVACRSLALVTQRRRSYHDTLSIHPIFENEAKRGASRTLLCCCCCCKITLLVEFGKCRSKSSCPSFVPRPCNLGIFIFQPQASSLSSSFDHSFHIVYIPCVFTLTHTPGESNLNTWPQPNLYSSPSLLSRAPTDSSFRGRLWETLVKLLHFCIARHYVLLSRPGAATWLSTTATIPASGLWTSSTSGLRAFPSTRLRTTTTTGVSSSKRISVCYLYLLLPSQAFADLQAGHKAIQGIHHLRADPPHNQAMEGMARHHRSSHQDRMTEDINRYTRFHTSIA